MATIPRSRRTRGNAQGRYCKDLQANRDVIQISDGHETAPNSETNASVPMVSKSFFDDLRAEVTCKICFGMLYEPYTVSCGHTYCYSCLCQWFGNNSKKTCPDCRTAVREAPAPAYNLRNITRKFFSQHELLAHDETGEQHLLRETEEANIVEKDKQQPPPGGLFKGCFRYRPARTSGPIRDDEDGVDRCPNCTWELEGDGDYCARCDYRLDGDYGSSMDSDEDDALGLEGVLEDDMLGPLDPPIDLSDYETEDDLDAELELEDQDVEDSFIDDDEDAEMDDRDAHEIGSVAPRPSSGRQVHGVLSTASLRGISRRARRRARMRINRQRSPVVNPPYTGSRITIASDEEAGSEMQATDEEGSDDENGSSSSGSGSGSGNVSISVSGSGSGAGSGSGSGSGSESESESESERSSGSGSGSENEAGDTTMTDCNDDNESETESDDTSSTPRQHTPAFSSRKILDTVDSEDDSSRSSSSTSESASGGNEDEDEDESDDDDEENDEDADDDEDEGGRVTNSFSHRSAAPCTSWNRPPFMPSYAGQI